MITEWLAILNLIMLVGGGIVGFFTVRSAISKSNQDTQDRVRGALHDENELLQSQVKRQGEKITRLERVIDLLITAFEKLYGVKIEVDEDTVTIRSSNGTHVSRIPTTQP